MSTTPFIPRGVFGPEAVEELAAVLRDVCRELRLEDGSDLATEVAETIIHLASARNYDKHALRAAVLTALRPGR